MNLIPAMTRIEGGAIKDMSPETREKLERHVLTCPGLPVHPFTGEVLPRKDPTGVPQDLTVKVLHL